jgi:hypothetical protein
MNGRSDMTPEKLTAIRNRAAALDYMHYDKKERTLLNEAAEDRNSLLAELDATRAALNFMMRECWRTVNFNAAPDDVVAILKASKNLVVLGK